MAISVNPSFRLDVDGKLFKNKESNTNIQETLFFSNLLTRLSINKGDLPLFPDMGLKQWLGKFVFKTDQEIGLTVASFEQDLETQLNRTCHVSYETDSDNKYVKISIEIDGLELPASFEYNHMNGSIRIIEPQILDNN